MKYTFKKLPRFNLETIAMAELGEGKGMEKIDARRAFVKHDVVRVAGYGNVALVTREVKRDHLE